MQFTKGANNSFYWISPDGLKIFGNQWPVSNAKVVIAVVHGLGEHCMRYAHVASYFNENKIALIGYDRRGHGRSEGKKGHTPSYSAFLDEVDGLMNAANEFFPGLPVFLYGHSMGGNIALNYLLERKPSIKGIIATGSWIELPENPPAILLLLARVMIKIFPSFSQSSGLDANNISRNKKEVEKYLNDPFVHDRISSMTGLEMIKAAQYLKNYKGSLPVPALIMHGGNDKLTSANGSKVFAENVSGDVELKIWEGLFHEIHNEDQRQLVFDYMMNWIDRKM